MTKYIYHIVSEQEWKSQQSDDGYTHTSLEAEGFIHCSLREQVKGVLSRYFDSKEELLVLTIDSSKLSSLFIMEESTGNEKYPHVYGPVNKEAIIEVDPISNWLSQNH